MSEAKAPEGGQPEKKPAKTGLILQIVFAVVKLGVMEAGATWSMPLQLAGIARRSRKSMPKPNWPLWLKLILVLWFIPWTSSR